MNSLMYNVLPELMVYMKYLISDAIDKCSGKLVTSTTILFKPNQSLIKSFGLRTLIFSC